jgi:hypothetical protein
MYVIFVVQMTENWRWCGGAEIVLTMKASQLKLSFEQATTIQMETMIAMTMTIDQTKLTNSKSN